MNKNLILLNDGSEIHYKGGNVIEARLAFLNYGLSKVWTVFFNGQETSCWSAMSAKAALKRFKC